MSQKDEERGPTNSERVELVKSIGQARPKCWGQACGDQDRGERIAP